MRRRRYIPLPSGEGLGVGRSQERCCERRDAVANQTARTLRKNETIEEKRLWKKLRQLRQQGYHFRRQHPIELYIVDFACLSQMLIIEVDGIQHLVAEHMQADAARDARLNWLGWRVLRFSNGDVANTLDGVVLEVLAALGAVAKHE